MSRFSTILFDLDGTLSDNGEGITNSVAYALRKMGLPVPPREVLDKFIGPPLRDQFVAHHVPEDKGDLAVEYYREYFRPTGIFENVLYDGIPAMLSTLQKQGMTLAICTSKPEIFAKQIADHFSITPYFSLIAGSDLEYTRVKKKDVISYALDLLGITDLSGVVMVGDREHDVLGAKAVGIPCIGVTYGYGTKEELENAGATALLSSPQELCEYLQK